jgi:hypothetical protein
MTLAEQFSGLRYVPKLGKWIRWDGIAWRIGLQRVGARVVERVDGRVGDLPGCACCVGDVHQNPSRVIYQPTTVPPFSGAVRHVGRLLGVGWSKLADMDALDRSEPCLNSSDNAWRRFGSVRRLTGLDADECSSKGRLIGTSKQTLRNVWLQVVILFHHKVKSDIANRLK